MSRSSQRKPHICKQCKTRFRGQYCPYCGAEYGRRHGSASRGVAGGLFRFIGTLLLLAVVVLLALAVLDCTPYANDPNHPTIYAIVTSIRNAIPSSALMQYESIKAKALGYLSVLFHNVFS
jgi:hypothetical protein